MKKLFIIGNGFDIQHKIKSKYQDFHDFIKKYYFLHKDPFFIPGGGLVPKILNYEPNEIGLQEKEDALAYLDYTITLTEEGDDWWNLENSLAKLYLIQEFDEASDDFFSRGIESPENTIYYIGLCFKFFYRIFDYWVEKIDISDVKPNKSFQKLIDPDEDYFFHLITLKLLKKYIMHGMYFMFMVYKEREKSWSSKKDEEYIIEFCKNNKIPLSCLEGVKYLFEITEKDTRKIYEENKEYFNSLDSDIKEIYSYGFSFSMVDMIYIFAICHSIDTTNITWYMSDFSSEKQIEKYKKSVCMCGFKGKFKTFHIKSNIADNIILFLNRFYRFRKPH